MGPIPVWILLSDGDGPQAAGAAAGGVCTEDEVPAAKPVTEEINYSAHKRQREPPPEGIQVVSTRITKAGVSSSGAKSEMFLKGKIARNVGRNRW